MTIFDKKSEQEVSEIKYGVKGRFKFEIATKEDRSDSKVVAEFDNLITNLGLDTLIGASTGITTVCSVGTGTATPTSADVALQTAIARQTRTSSSSSQNGAPDYTIFYRSVYAFAQGAAAGNLTEVGVGATSNGANNIDACSRALIVDGSGNPTTLTIQATEYLTVTYTLSLVPNVSDITGTASGYSYTLRPARITFWGAEYVGSPSGGSSSQLSTQALQAITSFPAGTTINSSSVVSATYISGTYYRDHTINWSPAAGAITATSVYLDCGKQQWQIGLSPSISKTTNDNVTLTIRLSIQRL